MHAVLPGCTIRLQNNQILKIYQEGKHAPETEQMLVKYLGPVVQSIVSLTSFLVVKKLTVLVGKISNSQVFLLKKCE